MRLSTRTTAKAPPPVSSQPNLTPKAPVLSLPEEEARALRAAYRKASVILEYGSGGSTVIAAKLPGKLVFSVESDPLWAQTIQHYLDSQNFPSPVIVHAVDIGPVGAWGRPLDGSQWKKFHHYPMGIWDAPFFRHPDVVLIDGRFRAACLAVTRMRITRPVTVLFDDYADRKAYHAVEALVGAPRMVGRMAVFDLAPAPLTEADISGLMGFMTQATYVSNARYR